MTHTEVLVVGGGPAGSTVAWVCVRSGLDVTVIDRSRFPRDKVCAGWITPPVLQSLELDVGDYARGRTLQPIHAFRLGVIGGREVTTRSSPEPVSYGIRRCEFDHYLLQRSRARLRLGEPLRELRRDGEHWVVDDALRARVIVGAGGHFCPVARHLGARVGRDVPAVVAQEVEFESPHPTDGSGEVRAHAPLLLFCADLKGYGWAFRKGTWLNVGLGRENPDRLASHVADFRRRLMDRGTIPESTPERFRGHAYRLYPHTSRRPYADRALLVGDAAGLAHPRSGEGIRPAVESGLMAARVVVEAAGRYDATRLSRYADLLAERFGSRAASTRSPESPGGLRRALAHRLIATEWFARRVIRDRWFLQRHREPLRG